MAGDGQSVQFVQALLRGGQAFLDENEVFLAHSDRRSIRLGAREVRTLERAGILDVRGPVCTATPLARAWVKRQLAESDGFAAQHRQLGQGKNGETLNLAEHPLLRLANTKSLKGEAFLPPHLLEAGLRLARAGQKAALRQRVTMSYSRAHTGGQQRQSGAAAELSEHALDARKLLHRLEDALPRDCASVAFDVCVWEKGLQQIEAERGWPRRSAKLVLRIALEQVAQFFGIDSQAQGAEAARPGAWRDAGARPTRFE